jgi:hypothetical protein
MAVIEGVGSADGAAGAAPGTGVWRPEHVTASWLTDVLRHAGALGDGQVVGFDCEVVGTGQMADSFRLSLRYDGPAPGAPPSVVGKFTAADATSRSTGIAMRTSEVEVRFYQEVASTVGVRTPRCYHADVDPATAEFVLVLEDLAPARAGDQVAGCSVSEAALALTELAALHAPRWGDPALDELEWLNRRTPESNDVGVVLMPALFEGFADRYGGVLDASVLEVGRRLMSGIGGYLRHQPRPWTVQHADYRLDNLLFGTAEGGAGLAVVDWQTVTLGPGVADVSYFLGAGPSVEDRRRGTTRARLPRRPGGRRGARLLVRRLLHRLPALRLCRLPDGRGGVDDGGADGPGRRDVPGHGPAARRSDHRPPVR